MPRCSSEDPSETMIANEFTYDFRGMQCPMPIVQLSRVVGERQPGDVLTIVADDLAFCFDVESWCRRTGHELVRVEQSEQMCTAVVRVNHKGGDRC